MAVTDINRKPLNFHRPVVEEVVPSHFLAQYPKFVSLLKKFYVHLAESGKNNNVDIENIFTVHDRESAPDAFLDYMFHETVNGLGADRFNEPRLTLKLVPSYYPIKGTTLSVTAFFRYIYGVTATQFYPKTRMFTLNESELGGESLRFLQDSHFYQILSIQIKSPLGISEWRDIYKRFNHAAGFALFAETLFEEKASNLSAVALFESTTAEQNTEYASTLSLVFDDEESSFVRT